MRVLMTGAAGGIGSMIRKDLARLYPGLILSDLVTPKDLGPEESFVRADLASLGDVEAALDGIDAIAHFGGFSVEGPWDTILEANIIGCYNLFEAARRKGVKRVVFASSNHAMGFYPRHQRSVRMPWSSLIAGTASARCSVKRSARSTPTSTDLVCSPSVYRQRGLCARGRAPPRHLAASAGFDSAHPDRLFVSGAGARGRLWRLVQSPRVVGQLPRLRHGVPSQASRGGSCRGALANQAKLAPMPSRTITKAARSAPTSSRPCRPRRSAEAVSYFRRPNCRGSHKVSSGISVTATRERERQAATAQWPWWCARSTSLRSAPARTAPFRAAGEAGRSSG